MYLSCTISFALRSPDIFPSCVQVSTKQIWKDVSEKREARKALQERLDTAEIKRESKLLLVSVVEQGRYDVSVVYWYIYVYLCLRRGVAPLLLTM